MRLAEQEGIFPSSMGPSFLHKMRSGQVDESHLANIMKKYIWLFGECPPMEIFKI